MPSIAASGEDVERRDHLCQQTRLAVDDGRDERQQPDAARARRDEAERRVGLEHVVLDRPDHADLPDVVHHAHAVEARRLGRLGDLSQAGPELVRAARPGEVGDVQAELHARNLPDHVALPRRGGRWHGR
jgi:hypothetical protein